jgi:hypothetical protein
VQKVILWKISFAGIELINQTRYFSIGFWATGMPKVLEAIVFKSLAIKLENVQVKLQLAHERGLAFY